MEHFFLNIAQSERKNKEIFQFKLILMLREMKRFVYSVLTILAGILVFSSNLPAAQPDKETIVQVTTDFGVIKIKLYNETPQHRDNFLRLIKDGFYDGLLFHRVIAGFMIQGGDPDSRSAAPGKALGNGDPGYTIPAEFNAKYYHKKGALAAARLGDNVNPQKASSGCQFYIVQGKTYTDEELKMFEKRYQTTYTPQQLADYKNIGGVPHLDNNYTVFGEVIEGLDVVDKIAAVKVTRDRPDTDVKMKISILK